MSPELINGHPYDVKSDIWALGCLIYELCAGQCVHLARAGRRIPAADLDSPQSALPRGSDATGTCCHDPGRQDPRSAETVLVPPQPGRQGDAAPECTFPFSSAGGEILPDHRPYHSQRSGPTRVRSRASTRSSCRFALWSSERREWRASPVTAPFCYSHEPHADRASCVCGIST